MSQPESNPYRPVVSDDQWAIAYWQHMATTPPGRVWRQQGWDWLPHLRDDERRRRTLVWGRWVLALWHCRCTDCRADAAHLEAIIDQPMEHETEPGPTQS